MTPSRDSAPRAGPDDSSAVERAIAEACLGARAGDAIAADLGAFLADHGASDDDIAAAATVPAGLAVYRSLVRNGLSSVVLRMLPRTRARMNAACAGRFDLDFAKWVDALGPRTHYLRDVPAELLAWADPRWRSDEGVPGYLPDLAAFELAQFGVSASEAVAPGEPGEVALERALAFSASARLLRLDWAVHELPAGEDARDEPARRTVRLLAYRDEEHTVRWLELTPLAARVIERLMTGEPLGAALAAACDELGASVAIAVTDVAKMLGDLGQRGVILGART
jgi:hypothetical protein